MPKRFIFSSESVGEGHPDKVADFIADSILDGCLEQDPHSRVACEVMVKSNCVFLAGEISTKARIDYENVVRQAIRDIGYTDDDDIFHADHVFISNSLTEQSPEIAHGVDAIQVDGKASAEQGAGDQGIMFGYACKDTEEMLPAPIVYAHKLTREAARLRKLPTPWLRPDCKSQVAVVYKDNKPVEIANIVLSVQHTPEKSHAEIRAFCIEHIIKKILPKELITENTQYLINPTGSFIIGGPQSDAGLTGRKIIVDTYGAWSRHGGGSFSGKDPSKVDRSGAYMCRWVAKNIVAAGLADQVELQIAYAIGYPNPTSIHLSTFGYGHYPDEVIIEAVKQVFSFKPANIIKELDLLKPIYKQTTFYGHFTKPSFTWEQTNRIEALQAAVKKILATQSTS